MKDKMYLYYDEEGDFLEINIGEYTKGYFRDVGDGLSERKDEKTGKITGVAIMSFRKRTLKETKISLPFKLKISA